MIIAVNFQFKSIGTGLEKNLNSNLPIGQVTLKLCLPRHFPPLPRLSNLLIIHEIKLIDGLPGPLPVGQVRMKSHLPGRKIYLSWTTGRGFWWALRYKERWKEEVACCLQILAPFYKLWNVFSSLVVAKKITDLGLQIIFFTWKDIPVCPTKTPSWSDNTKLWSDRYLFIVAVKWFMMKKLPRHHVRPRSGFRWTLANFGRPMSDERLLFAALLIDVVLEEIEDFFIYFDDIRSRCMLVLHFL